MLVDLVLPHPAATRVTLPTRRSRPSSGGCLRAQVLPARTHGTSVGRFAKPGPPGPPRRWTHRPRKLFGTEKLLRFVMFTSRSPGPPSGAQPGRRRSVVGEPRPASAAGPADLLLVVAEGQERAASAVGAPDEVAVGVDDDRPRPPRFLRRDVGIEFRTTEPAARLLHDGRRGHG